MCQELSSLNEDLARSELANVKNRFDRLYQQLSEAFDTQDLQGQCSEDFEVGITFEQGISEL